jgi:hypothetical protein
VRRPAPRERQLADPFGDQLIADLEGEFALNHVKGFVPVVVMERGPSMDPNLRTIRTSTRW